MDLSAAAPAWEALPDMNVERGKLNSVLLPDGRVLIMGGWENPPDGGPVEIFDPEDPAGGFQLGPNMKYPRGYHSAAILMPDGSVVMGGDPGGDHTPNERYLPSYFFKPRPQISSAPATISYGGGFSIQTPVPNSIGEAVLMRPGAVTHAFNQSQRAIGCTITGASTTAVSATAPPRWQRRAPRPLPPVRHRPRPDAVARDLGPSPLSSVSASSPVASAVLSSQPPTRVPFR